MIDESHSGHQPPLYEAMGRLLTAAIAGWAAREGKSIRRVHKKLAAILGRTYFAIASYAQGHSRPRYHSFKLLIQECTKHAHLNEQWVVDMLYAYDHPGWVLPEGEFEPIPLPLFHNPLPLPYRDFVERQQVYSEVIAALHNRRTRVMIISGVSGVGKSSMALAIAYRCLERLPEVPKFDGLVWINAHNQAGIELIETIVATIATTFKVPEADRDNEVERLLHDRQVLLFIDDYHPNSTTLALWLPGVLGKSKVIVTCSAIGDALRHFTGYQVSKFNLEGMNKKEAEGLVSQLLEPTACKQLFESPSWEALLEVIAGNPKAIELAVGLLQNKHPIEDVLCDLRTADRQGSAVFEILFGRSWAVIKHDQAARKVLQAMTLFPRSVSRQALAATSGVRGAQLMAAGVRGARPMGAIERLESYALLHRVSDPLKRDDRFVLHALVRTFAAARLAEHPIIAADMRKQLVTHYLHFLKAELGRKIPSEPYWNALIGDQSQEQLERVDQEWHNLRAVLTWLVQNKDYPHLIEFMLWLAHYMDHRGLYKDRLQFAEQATTAGAKAFEIRQDPTLLHNTALLWIDILGWARLTTCNFEAAEETINEGLKAAEEAINEGLKLVQRLPPESQAARDLSALAHTFLTRLYLVWQLVPTITREKKQELRARMQENRLMIRAPLEEYPPAIGVRVAMTCGAVERVMGSSRCAINYFQKALKLVEKYEGEEEMPDELYLELGFAHLAQKDWVEADQAFINAQTHTGTIQDLWGQYGQACVAWDRGDSENAYGLAETVEDALSLIGVRYRLHQRIQDLLGRILEGAQPDSGVEFNMPDDLLIDIHKNHERFVHDRGLEELLSS